MKVTSTLSLLRSFLFVFIFCFSSANAQEDNDIIKAYNTYNEPYREVVYLHLNKSTYIKGEALGFKAYVLDKNTRKPSKNTTNLYVSVEDENNNILKQKLVKVTDGVASNLFEVDSLFTSGNYKIKAYTNWMRNFDERNHHEEYVRVIDPSKEKYISTKTESNKNIDAQFLPESGHLLNGVVNSVGVVIKNQYGYGVPFAMGEVMDGDSNILSSFETNQFGIGKFQLLPDASKTYKVKISDASKNIIVDLNSNIETKGVILSLKTLKSKVFVSVITNNETFEDIKNKRFGLMIHNGKNYDLMDIYFTDEPTVTKIIELHPKTSGVNVVTLFNENDQPIAERLFFNYEGIDIVTSSSLSASSTADSLSLKFQLKNIDNSSFNSLSVSVLPEATQSYKRHHNLVSQSLLQPYLNGQIEQAKYYFSDVDTKKRYELDNLLLTQGWGSYDWNFIFNGANTRPYDFEQGIKVVANINNQDKKEVSNYMVHSSTNNEPVIFNLSKNDIKFSFDNIFPVEDNQVYISEVTNSGALKAPQLYIQSFPNSIPIFKTSLDPLAPKNNVRFEESFENEIIIKSLDGVQNLDEVVIKGRLEKKRILAQELTKSPWGKIHVFDDNDRQRFATLTQFINNMTNFRAYNTTSGLVVENPISYTRNTGVEPFFFLDDMPLYNTNILNNFPMFNVDYIEVNATGIGEGIRGGNGVIKIYTRPSLTNSVNRKGVNAYKLSLAFNKNKTFYVPKYKNYNDDFYKEYGTIDWKPKMNVDENGFVIVKIKKPEVPITLFIEGITNNGKFISDEKSVSFSGME